MKKTILKDQSQEYGSVDVECDHKQLRSSKSNNISSRAYELIRKKYATLVLFLFTIFINIMITSIVVKYSNKRSDVITTDFQAVPKMNLENSFAASQCQGSFRESFTSFSASGTPKKGSELLIHATGTLSDGTKITEGFISVDVYYGTRQVYFIKDLALCGQSVHKLPFDAGALSTTSFSCPISSGEADLDLGVKLPWFTPGGTYNITTKGCMSQNGQDLCNIFCVNTILTL